jgi:hypothetical protein
MCRQHSVSRLSVSRVIPQNHAAVISSLTDSDLVDSILTSNSSYDNTSLSPDFAPPQYPRRYRPNHGSYACTGMASSQWDVDLHNLGILQYSPTMNGPARWNRVTDAADTAQFLQARAEEHDNALAANSVSAI